MKKIMFNDKYGLTQAVLSGQKTMTRRTIKCPSNAFGFRVIRNGVGDWFVEAYDDDERPIGYIEPVYNEGEVVAIAQPYKEVCYSPSVQETVENKLGMSAEDSAGWNNKMFVKADLMPHHIKITNVNVERLQDCSDDDILKEGVQFCANCKRYTILDCDEKHCFETPREAFAALIDRVSGKGTWKNNPWVYAYAFKLVK